MMTKKIVAVRQIEVLLSLMLLGVAGLMYWYIQTIPADAGYSGISPRFFPYIVVTGFAVCGILLFREAISGGFRHVAPPEHTRSDDEGAAAGYKGLAWALAGLVLHMLLIGKLGFILTSALLFCFTARAFGSKNWLKSLLIGVLLSLPVYLLFTQFLKLNLPGIPGLHF